MRGSVRQRARGVWEIRIYVGRDPATGRKRYKSRTVRGRRRDAEQVCRDLLSEIDTEPDVAVPEVALPTLGEWLDEWWELKKPTLSPTTVSSWRSSVERYLKPELGAMPLHEVRAVDLERLYQRRIESGLTAARVQKIHTVASVAFKAAVRRGLIATSPTLMAQVPAVGRQEPKAPSAEEVGVLLAAAASEPDLHAFLVVAANTGARRAEICAVRWCDVNLGSRTMTISKSVAKGAGGGATIRQTKTGVVGQIAISDQVVKVLSSLLERRRDAAQYVGAELPATAFIWSQDVCGARPVYPDTMSARFRRVRDDAGLPHVQLRHLRHFAATQLLSAGVDVRTVAGRLRHARPAMTLDRYAAWVPAQDRRAADILGDLGG